MCWRTYGFHCGGQARATAQKTQDPRWLSLVTWHLAEIWVAEGELVRSLDETQVGRGGVPTGRVLLLFFSAARNVIKGGGHHLFDGEDTIFPCDDEPTNLLMEIAFSHHASWRACCRASLIN